jgi:UTP-glucose-1-phosphate uridylyltransferase
VQIFINFANFYKRFVHAFFKTNAELISLLKKKRKREIQNQIRHDLRDEKIHEINKKSLHERVDVTSL